MSAEKTETVKKTKQKKKVIKEKKKEEEKKIEETLKETEEVKVEEEKPAPKKEEKEKKKEEENVVEERIYTVPLSRAWIAPRTKHSPKAIRVLRGFIVRHMKADEASIKITNEVNEKIWGRGIQKPPRKIRVRTTKDSEGIVTVHLAEGD